MPLGNNRLEFTEEEATDWLPPRRPQVRRPQLRPREMREITQWVLQFLGVWFLTMLGLASWGLYDSYTKGLYMNAESRTIPVPAPKPEPARSMPEQTPTPAPQPIQPTMHIVKVTLLNGHSYSLQVYRWPNGGLAIENVPNELFWGYIFITGSLYDFPNGKFLGYLPAKTPLIMTKQSYGWWKWVVSVDGTYNGYMEFEK